MKICDENYPEVRAGDLVEVTTSTGVLRFLACNHKDGLRLNNIRSGKVWNYSSLFDYLAPHQIKIITNDYCLKKID